MPDAGSHLADDLADALGASAVHDLVRLSGGASRETWAFDADIDGRARALVLQRPRPGAVRGGGGAAEADLLRATAEAGVPVPAVVWASGTGPGAPGSGALGTGALVVERLAGETIPRRILREPALAGARAGLARQCGEAAARIHAVDPVAIPGLEGGDELARYRTVLDDLRHPHPAFELAFRWLGDNRPAESGRTLVHGDLRLGNLLVGPEGLVAVLDWELAHLGDPLEDLGWLCVRSWRFGAAPRVGGFGEVDDLVAAYEGAGGGPVDRAALHWWEVLGTLKWGIMCIAQAEAHRSGAAPSVELAAIGRRVCEVEHDVLLLLPGPSEEPVDERSSVATATEGLPAGPHDVPTALELLDAVRTFLADDVLGATEGRVRFHARVAANVVATVARELALGPGQAVAHATRLAALGVADDAGLAQAIRTGALDDRTAEVRVAVAAAVADKLAVANPGYAGSST